MAATAHEARDGVSGEAKPATRGEKWARPWIFRMTLSCSRHGYEEPAWGQQRDGFLRAREHAFLEFGGVPEVRLMVGPLNRRRLRLAGAVGRGRVSAHRESDRRRQP